MVVHQKQKLAKNWLTDVYIVQRQQGGSSSPVYAVKREDGKGPERVLHRNMLLPCDQLPLPMEPVSRLPTPCRRPRQARQRSVADKSPPRPAGKGDLSSSTDECEDYVRVSMRHPPVLNHGREESSSTGLSSDDQPLAYLQRLDSQGKSPTLTEENSSESSSRASDQSSDDKGPPVRPRRVVKPPDRYEYDPQDRPAWRY